jgi:hypothetical protein
MAQPKHQVSPLEANNCLRVPGTLPVECAEIDTRHWENVS